MEKKKKPIIVVVIIAVLISGYFIWEKYFTGDQLSVEASGTIEAMTVELTAKLPGTIQNIKMESGDKIEKGQLAAQLSRNDLIAQRERDRLNVLIAQNKLDDLIDGARSQQIKEAQANVNIMQVAYDKAKKDLERAEESFENGTLKETELEAFQNSKTISYNQLEAAQAALSLLLAGSSDNQIKAAQNQVRMLEAVLKTTEAVLEDLNISSPIDGTIQSMNYEIGEYMMTGASLATVVNLNKVWINVYVSTEDLPYVKLGEKAEFSVSGLDKIFEGTISEIATRGEFTPKTIQTKKERVNIVYRVKIDADNSEGILKPGMPADVMIRKATSNLNMADEIK